MIDRLKRVIRRLDAWSNAHRTTRVWRRAIGGFLAHDALQFAGSMAYFGVLSLFQVLVLAIVVGSFLLGDGEARDFVIDQVVAGSPLDAATVEGVLDAAIESRGGMTIISFGFLLWSALGMFSALSSGISRAFENAPPRSFVMDKLVGLLLMALTGALALGSLVIGVATGVLQRIADQALAGVQGGGTAVWLIGLLVPMILIFGAFWLIYRIVPNRPVSWMEVLPGAVTAMVLWTVLRVGFTWYATSIANYDSAFGPISTAITLLVFLYFASVIVLLGAEVSRANAIEDELGLIDAADPRFLPVAVDVPSGAAPTTRRGLPRVVVLAGGALIGVVIGRITKRDDPDSL
jgi:membrane protein